MTYILDLRTPDYGISVAQRGTFGLGLATVGNTVTHSRNQTVPVQITLTWTYTGAEMEVFRQDWDRIAKLNHGADWFALDLPAGVVPPYSYSNQQGAGYQRFVAHFIEPYQATYQPFDHWRVSAGLDLDMSPRLDVSA